MKKIFQIAIYDFKRLLLNPFTIIAMAVVFAVCFITGLTYKIPTAPQYTINISGESVGEVYSDFMSYNSSIDSKSTLDRNITQAAKYISVQNTCNDYQTLVQIKNDFDKIREEVIKYNTLNNTQSNLQYVQTLFNNCAGELHNFVSYFKNLDEFGSRVIFTNAQFAALEDASNFFYELAQQNTTTAKTEEILKELYTKQSKIDVISNTVSNNGVHDLKLDNAKLTELQENYINKANAKTDSIRKEIERLYDLYQPQDTEHVSEMLSLMKNYKLTTESAKQGIIFELELILKNHFGNVDNLYLHNEVLEEDTKVALTKINYLLEDKELYYTQHQSALNFNTASYQVSAYDHTYFIISIIGFLNILFGIFCAYKLFGLDRRNGKMDVILSQNVTYNQTFAGKFTAIVFVTTFLQTFYMFFALIWGLIFYPSLPNMILAVFNLGSAYTIHPFLFLLIKFAGIELQVIFYAVITIFLMNVSRRFDLMFAVSILLFVVATICNIYLNNVFVYCLFPFIHADITSFLGGGTMMTGFLKTSLYSYGNFFISLAYYVVVVGLFYNLTNQLFKRN